MKPLLASIAGITLLGAMPPSEDHEPPGRGVLCGAVFVYFAQVQGQLCYPNDDPEFQARLSSWAQQFDAYLIRNLPDGEQGLQTFKAHQGVAPTTDQRICTLDDDSKVYEHFRDGDREMWERGMTKVLSRDGPPSFGDCV
ncbi:MAG: hypothetical protein ABJN35_03680 [Erythrobacter sp.]